MSRRALRASNVPDEAIEVARVTLESHQVDYRTTRLRELRAQARRVAVEAARRKAEIYCEAAHVRLGRVLHIEDENPRLVDGVGGHVGRDVRLPEEEPAGVAAVGRIVVTAAVTVGYALLPD